MWEIFSVNTSWDFTIPDEVLVGAKGEKGRYGERRSPRKQYCTLMLYTVEPVWSCSVCVTFGFYFHIYITVGWRPWRHIRVIAVRSWHSQQNYLENFLDQVLRGQTFSLHSEIRRLMCGIAVTIGRDANSGIAMSQGMNRERSQIDFHLSHYFWSGVLYV